MLCQKVRFRGFERCASRWPGKLVVHWKLKRHNPLRALPQQPCMHCTMLQRRTVRFIIVGATPQGGTLRV